MNFFLTAIMSFSILPGAIIAWQRFERTNARFYPFIWLIWLGLANDLLSILLLLCGKSNILNANLFSLFQAVLILLQFHRLGVFPSRQWFYSTLALFVLLWIGDISLQHKEERISSYFIIAQSFVFVIISINLISRFMVEEPQQLFQNSAFLMCLGFVVYFTYAILVEIYWLYGLNHSHAFLVNLMTIHAVINMVSNIIFLFAVLWMPMKLRFILS